MNLALHMSHERRLYTRDTLYTEMPSQSRGFFSLTVSSEVMRVPGACQVSTECFSTGLSLALILC